ncbi:MAG: thiamine pyrophosphate-dependent enzyme, partial [Chloroflexota bacterium]|nr:thiamine pyrophosphate-dependent enzyme [Chloroflexota bacterium]
PEGEVEKARERDPVVSLANLLINESILTQKEIDSIDSNALKATDEATDLADASSQPPESVLHDSVYGP